MFTLKIKTGGASFGDTSYEATHEINRILDVVKEKLENGYTEGSVNDICGNKACTFELDFEERR